MMSVCAPISLLSLLNKAVDGDEKTPDAKVNPLKPLNQLLGVSFMFASGQKNAAVRKSAKNDNVMKVKAFKPVSMLLSYQLIGVSFIFSSSHQVLDKIRGKLTAESGKMNPYACLPKIQDVKMKQQVQQLKESVDELEE